MNAIDLNHLAGLSDGDFIGQAWQGLAGGEPPVQAYLWLAEGASRSWVLVRLWALARAGGVAQPCRLAGGRVARLANRVVAWPLGLQGLAWLVGAADRLTGRRRRRAALKRQVIARRLAQLEQMDPLIERVERLRQQQQAQAEKLVADLTRRIDLLAFEMRQVIDAATRDLDGRRAD